MTGLMSAMSDELEWNETVECQHEACSGKRHYVVCKLLGVLGASQQLADVGRDLQRVNQWRRAHNRSWVHCRSAKGASGSTACISAE